LCKYIGMAICLGPPQYKHSLLSRWQCFFLSNNNPYHQIIVISIGVKLSIGVGLHVSQGFGKGAILFVALGIVMSLVQTLA
jgi:hypothetical protein